MAGFSILLGCYFALFPYIALVDSESCGDPPVPHGLKLVDESQNNFVGKIVFYKCDFGFYSESFSGSSICELLPGKSSPEWLKPDLTCIKECAVPEVSHGEILESMFPYQNRNLVFRKVSVGSLMDVASEYFLACDPTYRPMGLLQESVQIKCKDGQWAEIPECLQARTECEPLKAPQHGTISYSTIETSKIGSIALFSCDPGYKLIGSTTSKCLEDIGWVFPTPNCTKPCAVPDISNGTIGEYINGTESSFLSRRFFQKIPVGTVIDETKTYLFTCDPTPKPFRESPPTLVTCKNGEWSTKLECLHERSPSRRPFFPYGPPRPRNMSTTLPPTFYGRPRLRNMSITLSPFNDRPRVRNNTRYLKTTTPSSPAVLPGYHRVYNRTTLPSPYGTPQTENGKIEIRTSPDFRTRNGVLVIPAYTNLSLSCYQIGMPDSYLIWSVPDQANVIKRMVRKRLRIEHMVEIRNANANHSGTYTCQGPSFHFKELQIQVLRYRDGGYVGGGFRREENNGFNASACFIPVCRLGCSVNYLTDRCPICDCSNTSTYSAIRLGCFPPKCDPGCEISYSDGLCPTCKCFDKLLGKPRLSCLPPECRPGCSVNYTTEPCPTCNCDALYEYFRLRCPPPNCAPGCSVNVTTEPCPSCNCDGAPPDFPKPRCSILECADDCFMDFTSERCPSCSCDDEESSGTYNESRCSRIITGNTGLTVTPSKMFYEFGEIVSLSCPPGKFLSSDVQRMMCHVDGWSDSVPDCLDST